MVSVQKQMAGDLVNLVTSNDLVRILQTALYFTDWSVKQSIFKISILHFQGQFLTSILTIVQNFVKLPYLEVTFLETSYLRILGITRSIIYRHDELFQNFCRFCISPWILTSGKNFMVTHPVVQRAVLHPHTPHLPVSLYKKIHL